VRILALDTCDSFGSIALLRDEFASRIDVHSTDEDYSTWLLPAVKRVLSAESVAQSEIDLYAVAAGPGSFTGVRVGLTTVKAWAEVYGRPVAPVSRLQALAEESSGRAPYVAAFFDARRNQIFGALYRRDSQLIRVEDEAVLPPQEFLDWCAAKAGSDSLDWISPQPDCLAQLPRWSEREAKGETVEPFKQPLGLRIGLIGLRDARAGKLTDALRLDANYIRRSDAEIFWRSVSHGA
jgi:tRNA threonylcarbamoyladenosine biosynthesis protein TsaB